MTRLLVCGGRDYRDRERVFGVLDEEAYRLRGFEVLIHGGDAGADALAREWAGDRCVPTLCFPANWAHHGKRAGPIRNRQMIMEGKPDLLIAFPGGRETADMVRQAREAKIEIQDILE